MKQTCAKTISIQNTKEFFIEALQVYADLTLDILRIRKALEELLE
jgi:hypothetical protein